MTRHGLLLGIFLALGAVTAAAQELSEFRGSAGEISMIPKKSSGLSGSLGFSLSQSSGAFSDFGGNRYGGTLGGQLVQDRLWFFAGVEQQSSRMSPVAGETYGSTNAVDAKVMANLGDRQNLSAIFAQGRQPSTPNALGSTTPSSFLSMRYTGVVSDSMFFTANFSRRESTQPVTPGLLTPVNE